ncbi:hypothetical protein KUH03_05835 [Sphingobacterium sp. E70]|uniref:hypothetical protein n=1 Tax=Sphingobacterium sp. E70 TaxID=2853439 RepID=UPI00211C3E42|nr:hypothetical protein [Sphingobacterium sp. E70]ULT26420.1 hypothetical protein KUH03_05835 [Sphingobacterium sp. E70]
MFFGIGIFLGSQFVHSSVVAQEVSKTQDELSKPYNPEADAQKDIDGLLQLAKKEKKNIVIQAGGIGVYGACVLTITFIKLPVLMIY